MIEVIPREQLPQVETFVFEGNGVSLTKTATHIIGVANNTPPEQARSDDENAVAGEILLCANDIEPNAAYWSVFGFSVTREEGRTTITSPSNSVLNDRRTELQPSTGIHEGVFVEVNGHFAPMEFAKHLAAGEILMAGTDPERAAHDNFEHRESYSAMCQMLFTRLQGFAQVAVSKDSKKLAGRIAELSDLLTGGSGPTLKLNDRKGVAFLATRYAHFLPPIWAGMAARKDAGAQRATTKKIRVLATGIES